MGTIILEKRLDAFDVEYIDLLALLWQTGYLTFEERITDEFGAVSYKLTIPNLEIQFSLNQLIKQQRKPSQTDKRTKISRKVYAKREQDLSRRYPF